MINATSYNLKTLLLRRNQLQSEKSVYKTGENLDDRQVGR